jgi:hypothetical protein
MLESLKDAIDKAMTDPTSTTIDWVHTAAEIVEGVEVVLAVVTAAGVSGATASLVEIIEGVGGGVAWPVTVGAAAIAGEFAALGAGYAEAARKIKEDRSGIGFAEGAVLGAWKAPTDFVKSRFFEMSPEQNDFWPEAGVFAQHYYNAALALGYHYGYELNKDESAAFWKDLGRGQDLDVVLGLPIPTEDSPENDWVDFYIAAGARFAKLHIQGEDE